MRKKIVAGNWKMNLLSDEATQLMMEVRSLSSIEGVEVYVFPPTLYLFNADSILNDSSVKFGSQNVFYENKGAYTGEISVEMLTSLGAHASIIGHSERRFHFGETNASCNLKVKACLQNGLVPFLCCGESESVRDANNHLTFVIEQLEKSLEGIENPKALVVAYEPVWAIGTGKTANTSQIEEMHAAIRSFLIKKYGADLGASISILYGGSCNANNAAEIFSIPNVDGGLIGGAALKIEDFSAIIVAANGSN